MLIPLPLRIAVLGVVAANAFMIPSTMSVPDVKGDGLDALSSYYSRHSDHPDDSGVFGYLDCTGCKWPGPVEIDNSALLLWFTSSEDSKTILFNSVPIYPVPLDNHEPTSLTQIEPIDVEQRGFFFSHGAAGTVRSLQYSGSVSESDSKLPSEDGFRSVTINITIDSLDDESVELPVLQIHTLENPTTGIVQILSVFTLNDGEMVNRLDLLPSPYSKTLPRPALQPTESSCGTGLLSIFCRMRAFLESKLSASSSPRRHGGGCHGHPGTMGPPSVKGGPAKYGYRRFGQGSDHVRIQPMPFNQPPTNFMRYLHVFAISVIIPVLIGIAAGLTASILGLMFGTLVAWFWVKFVRGNKRGDVVREKDNVMRCDIAWKEEEWVEGDGLLDEKSVFAGHQEREVAEPPPGYVEKE